MVKIDKGLVPDPPPVRQMKYPWLELDVGDSFEMDSSLEVARINARQASARYKRDFSARMYQGKPRVWRWK